MEIVNIVASGNIGVDLDLNALSGDLNIKDVQYEPEQFPGLIYRPEEYPTVLLVFANGKVVITGASNVEMAETAFESLRSLVSNLPN